MKDRKERLYIAYGSNLNREQMARRCPTAQVVGTATLKNWRLMFYSVATIERHKGGKVPVLVWRIQPRDEQALDRYEGWPCLYRKERLRVTVNGRRVYAMAYIMNTEGRHYCAPGRGYLGTIHRGYLDADFDREFLLKAVEDSNKVMDVKALEKGDRNETDCQRTDPESTRHKGD